MPTPVRVPSPRPAPSPGPDPTAKPRKKTTPSSGPIISTPMIEMSSAYGGKKRGGLEGRLFDSSPPPGK